MDTAPSAVKYKYGDCQAKTTPKLLLRHYGSMGKEVFNVQR